MPAQTLIAAVLTAADVPLARQVAAARAAGADLVELRVDALGDPAAAAALLAGARELPVIVTVRSAAEGGAWRGAERERRAWLARLAALRPEYIDLELTTWRQAPALRRALAAQRGAVRLILSHHDFAGTPADLDAVFDALAATPADVLKGAFLARDAGDACRVLACLKRRAAQRPLIALAMGEAGLATRVLAPKYGARLTYAALRPAEASAPGQPTVAELRGLYRWARLGPHTRVYGVVGWPVAHSHSPAVHNAALAAQAIDAVYLPLPVPPAEEDLARLLDGLRAAPGLDFHGLSVTLPHKQAACDWVARHGGRIGALARRCGAVNTLARAADDTWHGENTDGPGALAALQAALPPGRSLRGLRVTVLGAGGVARAVVAVLRERGSHITVYNRTPERAARLADELGCAWRPWSERAAHAGDILVNCTSVGLWPAVDDTPVPDDALRPDLLVFDTVYRPARTRLLRAALARGCRIIDGVELFLRQAAAQHELWHGRPAPLAAMRAALPEV